MKRLSTGFAGVVVCLAAVSPAFGQPAPATPAGRPGGSVVYPSSTAPVSPPYRVTPNVPAPSPAPAYPSPAYSNSLGTPGDEGSNPPSVYVPYLDPYGGFLHGAADAIRAQGQFEKDFQRARLLNQEVERSKVDTRRKKYDEWLYERATRPTVVDEQERARKLELRRALSGMPLAEIVNGYALNTILDDLVKRGNLNPKDSAGAIDPDVLKRINVTSGSSGGSVGVLKAVRDGGPLNWPLPLRAVAYREEVCRLNQRAAEAVKLVQGTGQAGADMLNDMKEDIRRLRSKVSAHRDDLTGSQSIEATRFLGQLDDAVKALAQPDAAVSFADLSLAEARTVPELVHFMAQKGLKFAPAAGGDEAAYSALYNHLVGYALQAAQVNARD